MFEACLEEHPQAKDMMNDYKPAKIFEEDLFTELVRKLTFDPLWFAVARRKEITASQVVLDWTQAVG